MNVRNCKECGRLFNYIAGPPICPACKEELEKKFQKAKEYEPRVLDKNRSEFFKNAISDVRREKE